MLRTSTVFLLVGTSSVALACKPDRAQDEGSTDAAQQRVAVEASPSEGPGSESPKSEEAAKPEAAEPEAAEPEAAEPEETKPEETKPEPPPPPEFQPLPTAVGSEPLRVLLGGELPDTVHVIATHEHGRRQLVLYRLDIGERWLASQPNSDVLRERLDAAIRVCDDESSMYNIESCYEEAASKLPGIPAGLGPHLVHGESGAWELAHVEFDRQGQGRVLAVKRLFDFGIGTQSDPEEVKLKVYDMDGDKRSEILLVFPVSLPTTDSLDSTNGMLGFVLDKADLHVQFATTRAYYYQWSDVSTQTVDIETSWDARDENGDGFNDLFVRERSRESHDDEEEPGYGGSSDERKTDSTICIYELVADRWNCPKWLGTKLIDGLKLVESTTVPVEPEPPAPGQPEKTEQPAPGQPATPEPPASP